MTTNADNPVSDLLDGAAELLDLPVHLHRAAVSAYTDVGDFMASNLSGDDDWTVYPQGSMRLGTVVLPELDGEYDIDSVALRHIAKDRTTRLELRDAVGAVLRAYVDDREGTEGAPIGLKPGKRCWTLQFDEPFHMDILPAIPDTANPDTGISITDRSYTRWLVSDPIGYADWFHSRMAYAFELEHKELAKAASVNIQQIPVETVKTKLHRAVQILKIHRNRYFADTPELCPASVVITTLAGWSFHHEANLADTLLAMLDEMPTQIERDGDAYVVLNPVQDGENFADRWTDDHAVHFAKWITALREDILAALGVRTGLNHAVARLGSAFGQDLMAKSAEHYGTQMSAMRGASTGALAVGATGLLTSGGSGTKVRPHRFDGA